MRTNTVKMAMQTPYLEGAQNPIKEGDEIYIMKKLQELGFEDAKLGQPSKRDERVAWLTIEANNLEVRLNAYFPNTERATLELWCDIESSEYAFESIAALGNYLETFYSARVLPNAELR